MESFQRPKSKPDKIAPTASRQTSLHESCAILSQKFVAIYGGTMKHSSYMGEHKPTKTTTKNFRADPPQIEQFQFTFLRFGFTQFCISLSLPRITQISYPLKASLQQVKLYMAISGYKCRNATVRARLTVINGFITPINKLISHYKPSFNC